jgi:enterochelin esterase-like enzyme
MIPKRRAFQLTVFLTLVLLTACEPLAPQQTAQVIVLGDTPGSPETGLEDVLRGGSPVAQVSTPVPTETPTPTPTPLPTATPFVCNESAGQIVSDTFTSAIIGGEVPYTMYLPPCFFETWRRYPYVVLLHGTGYDEEMWLDLGVATALDKGIRTGTLPPMVLIMPDGGMLAESNEAPVEQSWEAVILDELLPMLESYKTGYCLWGAREGRAIGGISRGGFWAFSIALRHPDLFSAVGGHSPHFDPDHVGEEINPLDLASQPGLSKTAPRIWMDNAASDYVGPMVERMAQTLQERGVAHEYIIHPTGGHEMSYWTAHAAEYLAFYGQKWPRDVLELPSCEDPVPVG